jgi:hypothetical protein
VRVAAIVGLVSAALATAGLLVWLVATGIAGPDPYDVYDNESDDDA